ncbi:AAA family ATPase [Streptomyces palmae]|uniref:AAA family ATPase n=1 Tax=Streptomyces palmae TaxID=1701085 RepID=UPI001FD74A38|nr:AAA family ATPase [Streptomyces palmae]
METPPAPGPTMERFDPAVLHSGEPFTILYGPGVGDVFVDSAYQICFFEQALWRLLRADGFERIVFSSLQHPVYFRDHASRDLSRGESRRTASAPNPPGARTMRHPRLRGPLDALLVRDFGRRPAPEPPGNQPAGAAGTGSAPAAPSTGVSDPFGVMTLVGYLRGSKRRTAVVFPHAEEILRHTRAPRQLADALAGWADHVDDRNQWILVFSKPTLDEVAEFVRGCGNYPRLDTFVTERRAAPGRGGTLRIDHPQAAELERLIHAVRVRERLRIADWRELDPIVKAMAAHPETARAWRTRLRELAAAGGELSRDTVRQWVGAVAADGRTPWERLAAMPGLDALKEHVEQLRAEVEANAELRAAGRLTHAEPPALHLVFTGNPGTGKTTVARLVGEMYRDLGLLSRGHVFEARISDLVAGYVGQTAGRTEAAVDRALDGVLFIDEAYGLSDQREGFGGEAIQTLLKRMEDDRGRLVVIVAGYPEKMAEFLAANPGLASRFPGYNIIDFPDYPPETLHAILLRRLHELGLRPAADTADRLREIATEMHRTRGEDFANARDMRTLADAVRREWARRVRGNVTEPVSAADIPEQYRAYLPKPPPTPAALLAELDDYVGLTPVREVLTGLADRLRMRQDLGKDTIAPPHLLFTGPPGTGKTTVARLIGKLFRDLGLLRRGHMVEATRTDLVAGYVGQTAPLVRQAVHDALDGVLFIDEAYSLVRDTGGQGGFGAEAIDTLNREMEEWRGRLVVIAAGYPRDMDALLDFNAGMRSRFTTRVPFPEYTLEDLVEILRRMAAADGYTLGAGVVERAASWLERTRRANPAAFGNARTVRGLLGTMEGRMAARYVPGVTEPEFRPEDVPGPPVSPPSEGG